MAQPLAQGLAHPACVPVSPREVPGTLSAFILSPLQAF